ncbi:MAG: glycosyltransferase family 2 protein [Acidobacteria bacterium]|nr:glycosyltransferase family 2 protein [Acidobacteriota bacterium]
MGDPSPPRTYSVVIPAFNAEKTLGEAVRSALAQVPGPLEVVVVDDGSVDATRAVAEGFGAAVRVFTGPNAGPSAARNRGVREARGIWIAFLDADDLFEPGYLAAAEEHLAANPDAGLLCFGVRVYEDGQRTAHVIHKKTPGPSYTTVGLLEGDVGTICTPLVARDASSPPAGSTRRSAETKTATCGCGCPARPRSARTRGRFFSTGATRGTPAETSSRTRTSPSGPSSSSRRRTRSSPESSGGRCGRSSARKTSGWAASSS